jgi:hypothetical protein
MIGRRMANIIKCFARDSDDIGSRISIRAYFVWRRFRDHEKGVVAAPMPDWGLSTDARSSLPTDHPPLVVAHVRDMSITSAA